MTTTHHTLNVPTQRSTTMLGNTEPPLFIPELDAQDAWDQIAPELRPIEPGMVLTATEATSAANAAFAAYILTGEQHYFVQAEHYITALGRMIEYTLHDAPLVVGHTITVIPPGC